MIIELQQQANFPIKVELHTTKFLLNKNPYKQHFLSDNLRIQIIDLFCTLIADLDLKIVNVVIDKSKISSNRYDILDKALTYSIQIIEHDLNRIDPTKMFIIVTDEGRVGKMRKTTRRIQRTDFIPSLYNESSHPSEIKKLIEDPLPKNSKESHFIQISDLVSYIVYLYSVDACGEKFSNRLPSQIDTKKIRQWLDILKKVLNTEASSSNEYGIVFHPK